MRATDRGWRICAMIYRTLVVAQTLGWAVASLARVLNRQPGGSSSAPPIAVALAVGSAVGIAAGVLTYYLRPSHSRDRHAVVLAWLWLQAGGLLALAGYAMTGTVSCFIVGLVALGVMHAFSPNRFQPT